MKNIKNTILDGIRYFLILTWWLGFILIGLWCVSCTTSHNAVEIYPHAEDFDFDLDKLISYDSDKNTGLYIVEDTIVSNGCSCIKFDTIELHFVGTMIEDLKQGEPAWVSENKYVLYD